MCQIAFLSSSLSLHTHTHTHNIIVMFPSCVRVNIHVVFLYKSWVNVNLLQRRIRWMFCSHQSFQPQWPLHFHSHVEIEHEHWSMIKDSKWAMFSLQRWMPKDKIRAAWSSGFYLMTVWTDPFITHNGLLAWKVFNCAASQVKDKCQIVVNRSLTEPHKYICKNIMLKLTLCIYSY